MRIFAVSAAVAMLTAGPALAEDSATFKDWMIGCDNLRGCIALGLPAEVGDGAYLKVTRSGDPSAEPAVEFVLYAAGTVPENPRLTIAFDDPSLGGLPAEPLAASDDDGEFLRARLSGDAARSFITAALKGTSLTVALAGSTDDPSVVSLSGATAALLRMDDVQKRIGTKTALVRPSEADAGSIPPLPPEPVVKAVKLTEIEDLPPIPAALEADPEDCPAEVGPMAIALSPAATLWGVCVSAGAYNYTYDFSIVERGKARPAPLELPAAFGEAGNSLTNPYVSDDGLTLAAFDKGRGIGDCGMAASWAWDGKAFKLVSYASMDDCRGVFLTDWPVLYRARVE